MKLIHLADLHLGKRVNGFSMLEDQKYILNQILNVVDDEQPDAVLIAGDVYDKSVPSEEAVSLLDTFLAALAQRQITVLLIAGNHDSAERLAFGGRLFGKSGIFVSPVYDGKITPIELQDAYGSVYFWLLPFLKPIHVRRAFPDCDPKTFDEAVKCAVDRLPMDTEKRNVLLTHQFVAGSSRCDSEEISVGGTDSVDGAAFAAFDYVALGHLHGPQSVGRDVVRYAGSPLKYSFSECSHRKSMSVVELGEKQHVSVRTVPLVPLREMSELKGEYDQLTLREFYETSCNREDYLHITLTDETDIPDAAARLRVIYPNLMKLDYDNKRTQAMGVDLFEEVAVEQSPMELFSRFYEQQNGREMTQEQTAYLEDVLSQIWEGAK